MRLCLQLWAASSVLVVCCLASPAEELKSFVGYTRPGYPNDLVSDGKIIFSADDKDQRGGVGGTIYYMVFRRAEGGQDPWGTGVTDLLKKFKSGIDFNGAASPELDTSAKYLYLYQVVNDRKTLSPIETASIKLLVEPADITSWGYFGGLGFAEQKTKEGEDKEARIQPVSFSNVVGPDPGQRAYKSPAPAVPIPQGLRLIPVPSQRGEKPERGDIINVVWDALDPAVPPDYVMLLTQSDFDQGSSFRAIWSAKNALDKGGRSTVFGFTSNLPPTIEPARIQTTREAAKASGIKFAGFDDKGKDDGDKILGAVGKVPTPRPEKPTAAAEPGTSPLTVAPEPLPLGQPAASPGAGVGIPFAPGGGAFGTARAPSIAGGGGSGSGSGNAAGDQTQQEDQRQRSGDINFNATLINQQAQAQLQAQLQFQKQTNVNNNNNNCCAPGHEPPGHVIPEPTTLLTAALGLPALWVLARRRRQP